MTLKSLGLSQDEKIKVDFQARRDGGAGEITDRIAPGVVFGGFHYPGEQNVNNLTNTALDPTAKIPEFKVCAVKVETA